MTVAEPAVDADRSDPEASEAAAEEPSTGPSRPPAVGIARRVALAGLGIAGSVLCAAGPALGWTPAVAGVPALAWPVPGLALLAAAIAGWRTAERRASTADPETPLRFAVVAGAAALLVGVALPWWESPLGSRAGVLSPPGLALVVLGSVAAVVALARPWDARSTTRVAVCGWLAVATVAVTATTLPGVTASAGFRLAALGSLVLAGSGSVVDPRTPLDGR